MYMTTASVGSWLVRFGVSIRIVRLPSVARVTSTLVMSGASPFGLSLAGSTKDSVASRLAGAAVTDRTEPDGPAKAAIAASPVTTLRLIQQLFIVPLDMSRAPVPYENRAAVRNDAASWAS